MCHLMCILETQKNKKKQKKNRVFNQNYTNLLRRNPYRQDLVQSHNGCASLGLTEHYKLRLPKEKYFIVTIKIWTGKLHAI